MRYVVFELAGGGGGTYVPPRPCEGGSDPGRAPVNEPLPTYTFYTVYLRVCLNEVYFAIIGSSKMSNL